jgi:hypothetical protein
MQPNDQKILDIIKNANARMKQDIAQLASCDAPTPIISLFAEVMGALEKASFVHGMISETDNDDSKIKELLLGLMQEKKSERKNSTSQN